ncbi:MAG: alternative ribosome rescue aminoacyl-tRNA hydrolase ArfB [Solirubrobacterales bacterium]|nr:alternative ribosome rescue aminoacyl-tRNA hydrolase ArfB [Solirubrobacterales bacterium]
MPITRTVAIPLAEIVLRTSRSSGPGGQHANVTDSRVEAIFDVEASATLSDEQKHRVVAAHGSRIVAVAQDARSQIRNRELALQRLGERLAEALHVPTTRRPTRPSRSAKRRRLDAKGRHSERKRGRRPPSDAE